MHKLFMSRENRDEEWRRVGGRRGTVRNQRLHPMYVADYEKETGEVLTPADRGFGNTIYATFFAVLYTLDF